MTRSLIRLGNRIALLIEVLAILAVVAVPGFAADEAPDAATVVDRYLEVTGGAEAYGKVTNRVTRGTMNLVAQGIELKMTVYVERPGKMYTLSEAEAIGKIEQGSDGETVWENNMMTGPRIHEGKMRNMMLRSSSLNMVPKWRDFYSAEYAGTDEVDGEPCHKIVMTANDGAVETRCYDQETGLLVRTEIVVEGPMGEIPVTVFPADYKAVDGILLPHTSKMVVMGQERLMTIASIEHNVEITGDVFELPEDIKNLMAAKEADTAEEAEAPAAESGGE